MSKPKKWDTMTQEERDAWMENRRNVQRSYCLKNIERTKQYKIDHYIKNREKWKERGKEWIKNNIEKNRILKLGYWRRNKEHYQQQLKNSISTISDVYVADCLDIKTEVLKKYPDLIEAKRDLIKARRIIKKQTNKQYAQEPQQP